MSGSNMKRFITIILAAFLLVGCNEPATPEEDLRPLVVTDVRDNTRYLIYCSGGFAGPHYSDCYVDILESD